VRRTEDWETQAVYSILGSPGWKVIDDCIRKEIDVKIKELVNKDSMNVADYARLQGEIRTLAGFLNWIKEREKQALESQN